MASKSEHSGLIRLLGIVLLCSILLPGCGAHVYHQVHRNDTLYSISWHYNQDYQQIAKWNGLNPPYNIKEGQWLRVAPPVNDSTGQVQVISKSGLAGTRTTANSDNKASTPRLASAEVIHWIWPVKGKVIQKFSADKPGKQGVDISAKAGTLVSAAAAGKVVYSGNGLRGYGNLIIIKHNEEFLSAYAHNQSIIVKEGAVVKQGQPIARVGNTESSQVMLSFQIRINGKPVDPLRYLPM